MHIILCIFFISHQITFLAILFLSLVCSSVLFYFILFYLVCMPKSLLLEFYVFFFVCCYCTSCRSFELASVRKCRAERYTQHSIARYGTTQMNKLYTFYILFLYTTIFSSLCGNFLLFFFSYFFFFQSCIFSLCLSFAFCVSFFCFLCIGLCQSHNNMHVGAEMRTAWTCIRLSKCTER